MSASEDHSVWLGVDMQGQNGRYIRRTLNSESNVEDE